MIKQDNFLALLKRCGVNGWFSISAVTQRFNLKVEDAYRVLRKQEKEGFIQSSYRFLCPCCYTLSGAEFQTFSELPNDFWCEHCHRTSSTVENAVLGYRMREESGKGRLYTSKR